MIQQINKTISVGNEKYELTISIDHSENPSLVLVTLQNNDFSWKRGYEGFSPRSLIREIKHFIKEIDKPFQYMQEVKNALDEWNGVIE